MLVSLNRNEWGSYKTSKENKADSVQKTIKSNQRMKNYKMNQQALLFMQTAFSILLIILAVQQFRAVHAIDYGGKEIVDNMALLAIKSQLIDHANNGVLSSWNHSLHHCSWEGVTCGPKHNRVITLKLPSRGLRGTISPFIGNLSCLRFISLTNNSLSGQIPPEIGLLQRLQGLYLYNNSLTGEIPPDISGCINLQNLSIAVNSLHGELPKGIGALSNLKYLWLNSNKFSGPLFKVIANLTSLESIYGHDNAFRETIQDSIISRFKNLRILGLYSNNFSGMVPPSIFNLSSLQYLFLGSNQFLGSIPHDIGSTLPQLQYLSLYDNHFSGPLPISLQNLTSLRVIELGKNSFKGNVSVHFGRLLNLQVLGLSSNNFVGDINLIITTLVSCSNLEHLVLEQNHFTGVLPEVLANLSPSLIELAFGGNRISGEIPKGISNLINLRLIDLSENELTGALPQELGKLQELEKLWLDSNKLTHELPDLFGNLPHLTTLSLFNNHFQGRIPPSLGSCESLLYLYLQNNNFKGPLPKELFEGSANFIVLSLSQNRLQGPLPLQVSKCVNLEGFDVSDNRLSGEIPPGLGSLSDLQSLYMGNNLFHGSIPSSFASLKSLSMLDLSQNNMSGPLPEYFSTFPLLFLNLSYNNFEGKVPTKGVYANASAIHLLRNTRLCGGIPELHLPTCLEKKSRISRAFKLTILIVCAFAGILAMATCIWVYLQCHHRRRRQHVSSRLIVKEPLLKVSYDMLLKATDGFSSANLLGSGTFGSVYKGILDGNTVAVKVLNLQQRGGYKSFMAECQMLRNIRHRNLVGIITACSSIDFQRNDFKALVYEFMPNGSLDRWLHEEGNLNLLQRLDIAIDVAHALNYLHYECEHPVVHRDLKPSNILLDNDLVAHVADFGLAKVLAQPLLPNQSSSIGVMGTVGYAAPEYGMGAEASLEADVYAYGILLLELMTRKRPTDNVFQQDLNLHMYAKAALPDQVMQIVDSQLTMDDQENELERLQQRDECITIVVKVGIACSDPSPLLRMKISAAISQLQAARSLLRSQFRT